MANSGQRRLARGKSNLFFGLCKAVKDSLIRGAGEAGSVPRSRIVLVALAHELWAVVKGISKGFMEAVHNITASHEDLASSATKLRMKTDNFR